VKKLVRSAISTAAVMMLGAIPAAAAKRVVDDDGQGSATNCNASAAAYFTISTALSAANAGDQIIICPGPAAGAYNEQLVIDKNVKLIGKNGAGIRPSPMLPNSTSLTSGFPIAAAILVLDSTLNVEINQLTIDGSGHGISGCDANPIGVYFRNASGSVVNSVVKNIRLGAGFGGCQSGLAIFAQSGGGGTSDVTVSNTSVHDFQKNGITGNESGTTLTASNNKVTGDGPTTEIAQNGIQIGFGATGSATGNVVSEVVWSPCSAPDDPDCVNGSSTGILIYQGSEPINVSNNTINTTQTGVYFDVPGGIANANLITRTRVYDGIYLPCGSNGNTVNGNTITNSDESGIWVDGAVNTVTKNKIHEAPIGVHHAEGNIVPAGGSGRNTFFNVAVPLDEVPSACETETVSSGSIGTGPVVSPAQ
jgi:parallel beta-helix repeat protein